MTERERLIELIVTAENEVFRAFPYTNSTKRIEMVADYLLKNGVIIVDEKTKSAMNAGASAIEKDEFLMMADYVYSPFKKPKVISYRRAAEILRELARKALKEREENEV